MLYNGITLGQLGLNQEAIDVYEEIERRYEGCDSSILREQIAKASLNKAKRIEFMSREKDKRDDQDF
ncbi:hypothetical protein [Pseudomonas poae]|uniref:hypothetical protein n=1 Tax=Pseudomonas poae TaxID=200451 RepID=UPI0011CDBF30|nr:hypothetical protein [Pseudomonas poae]